MKNIVKYALLLIIYLLLGTVLWGNQEYMLPIFIALYIVVHLYFVDVSKNFFSNYLELSGLVSLALLASLFAQDADRSLIVYYIGSMVISSLTVFYLKRTKNFSPSHD